MTTTASPRRIGAEDSNTRAQLLDAYLKLDAYPDALTVLRTLKARGERAREDLPKPKMERLTFDVPRRSDLPAGEKGLAEALAIGHGVALTNDSTYGHDVSRRTRPEGGTTTTVRQSLLRAPQYPDPHADQGRHVLRLTLRPGAAIAKQGEGHRRGR